MYEDHPDLKKPDNPETKIWHYMDFTKFVSLLDRQALFFARYDKFSDPFEGTYSKRSFHENREFFLAFYKHYTAWRNYVIFNCWHINDHESAAMWELYLRGNLGITIQSSVKRLMESFEIDLENTTSIGKVEYIDYESQAIPLGNAFFPFMHKRKDYEHERELRAVTIKRFPSSEDNKIIVPKQFLEIGGDYIPILLDVLIERVLISPNAPRWFTELVESIKNKYGINMEIVSSKLSEPRPIEIHVSGAVAYPNSIIPLPVGSTVQDAIDAAGGYTNQADTTGNPGILRQILNNGDHIHIPEKQDSTN